MDIGSDHKLVITYLKMRQDMEKQGKSKENQDTNSRQWYSPFCCVGQTFGQCKSKMGKAVSWIWGIYGKFHKFLRLQKIRNDDIGKFLDVKTAWVDKAIQLNVWWFGPVDRMSVNWIPCNAAHIRFKGEGSKGRPSSLRIDSINEAIIKLVLSMRGTLELTNDRKSGWH